MIFNISIYFILIIVNNPQLISKIYIVSYT